MGKRDRGSAALKRSENIREEIDVGLPELISFSFKDLDQTQPKDNPQTLEGWHAEGRLVPLVERMHQVSQLTRAEAVQQAQLKFYNDFPPKNSTEFFHPSHVGEDVCWGVMKHVGGQVGTVAGYLVENVFHVVFLDMNHKFWISKKKHT
ncbi:hypothetical protein LOY46_17365 [Pseudomonas sichuanensis]|uniref:hypothetical protein n=1 Tax=Pseudomonas sichuanensis TaxID=2213015 RepID=UPI002160C8EA|nr:hypothetical protein [Pseudomonas sichuanensis]UVK81332.1 hypothetical protein LOY46_17365 [Pseudomonas sichuanensis]